jgi:outer membrane protein
MKKLLGTLALAGIASIQIAQADTIGFEVGGYQWSPDYSGTLSSDDGGVVGDSININDDLGFSDASHTVIYFSLEHPLPFIPNFKLVSSDLEASVNDHTFQTSFEFGGETYDASESVSTTFDMSNIEYTFYYEILDNWLNLDLGMTIRAYDGHISVSTPESGTNLNESEPLDFTMPLFYASGRADLPFTGFFVDAQINIISYDGNSLSDTAFSLGYESEVGFGARLGYRTFSLVVEDDTFNSDLKFDGTYLNAFYHF